MAMGQKRIDAVGRFSAPSARGCKNTASGPLAQADSQSIAIRQPSLPERSGVKSRLF